MVFIGQRRKIDNGRMKSPSRRAFLKALGPLMAGPGIVGRLLATLGTAARAGTPALPGQAPGAFPQLEHFLPYPPGEPTFTAALREPTFIHPNGAWVVLPDALGGLELWDRRSGMRVDGLDGGPEGEHLQMPCGENVFKPGSFAADGSTWILLREPYGHDEPPALSGTHLASGRTWEIPIVTTAQLDPRRPLVHVVDNGAWGSIGPGVYAADVATGKPAKVLDLPPPLGA
jgi:hypothetical protein